MIAIKSICATLGKLLFVGFSLFTDIHFDHIFLSLQVICMFDVAIFVMLMVGFMMYGFDYDQVYIGILARKRAKAGEAKLRTVMKSFKEGELRVTKKGKFVTSTSKKSV